MLVTGASGLIGAAAVRRFLADGWEVVAVSRRPPAQVTSPALRHLSVDLTDAEDSRRALAGVGPISHIVYAAAYEKPDLVSGWSDPEQMATNRRMLDNVLRPVVAGGHLQHVSLLQGTKAYGVHLHPIPIPARERAPRDAHDNFYWHQEDLMRAAADEADFGWTILRPVQVIGPAYGVAYCTPPVIGVFAALCAEEGLPFGFPGGAIQPVKQAADARLVADALAWAAIAPTALNETFNLTNGEVFSWQELWPTFAESIGVECADPTPLSMGIELPRLSHVWERVVKRHGLQSLSLLDVLGQSHLFADYTFGHGITIPPSPALVSTVKVKQAGFAAVRDTEETFRHALRSLIEQRVLPDLTGGAQ